MLAQTTKIPTNTHVQTKIPTNTDTNKQINVLLGKHDAGVCGLSQKLSYYLADPFV